MDKSLKMNIGLSKANKPSTTNSKTMKTYSFQFIRMFLLVLLGGQVFAQVTDPGLKERFRQMSVEYEDIGLAEPFTGITTDGKVQEGLFPLRSTGVSTVRVRIAAVGFLNSLDDAQRIKTEFSTEDVEWHKWMNQDFYVRQGVSFAEMSEEQRSAAFNLMRASLNAKDLELGKEIMKLNYTLAEINDDVHRYSKDLLKQHYNEHPHNE